MWKTIEDKWDANERDSKIAGTHEQIGTVRSINSYFKAFKRLFTGYYLTK